MLKLSRRGFLMGCSATIAAMAGARINQVVFGNPEGTLNEDILIIVFLRGGCDALNLIPPIGGADRGYYETARPYLKVPVSGQGAALQLGNSAFGLHPAAGALHNLFQDQKLAIVQAAGLQEDTRSHFDAMSYMELGTPGDNSTNSGWLTRHFQTSAIMPTDILVPALAVGSLQPTVLRGYDQTTAVSSTANFNLNLGPYQWRDAHKAALSQLYNGGTSSLHAAGQETLNFVDYFEDVDSDYVPSNGVVYPDTSFGDRLQTIAQMIKLNVGLRVANVDLGGWDTHDRQGDGAEGYFNDHIRELSDGLAALYADLNGCGGTNYGKRLTAVVMSEFGRRLRENDDHGTDHGHGGMMMVMGDNVNGGIYGNWPGLHTDQLYDNADLNVTTDYRQVISEILVRRLSNPNLDVIFPDYNGYTPLGVVKEQQVASPPPAAGPHTIYLPVISKGC